MEMLENGLEQVEGFISELSFNRVKNGLDPEDVYACLEDIGAMYRDVLMDYKIEQENVQSQQNYRIHELEDQLQSLEQKLESTNAERRQALQQLERAVREKQTNAANGNNDELSQQLAHEKQARENAERALQQALRQMRDKQDKAPAGVNATPQANPESISRASEERASQQASQMLRDWQEKENSERMSRIYAEIDRYKDNVLSQLRQKVDTIVSIANLEAERIISQANTQAQQARDERDQNEALLMDLEAQRNATEANLVSLQDDLYRMAESMRSLREKIG